MPWSRAPAKISTRRKRRKPSATAELEFFERGTFGGNTSCVQVDTGGPEYLLCDLGSGVREFSLGAIIKHGPKQPQTYHVLISHVHWDHIMGFPFFVPCYIPGNRIILYSCHDKMEQAIRGQNHGPCFPVEFEALSAAIEFVKLEAGKTYDIAGAKVTGTLQLHGNDSYGYRIEKDGKAVIYTTDSEHKAQDRAEMERVAKFFDRRRPGDLRRHVFAGRHRIGEGRLGPFQQHHGRGTVPDGRMPRSSACSITSPSMTTSGWKAFSTRPCASRKSPAPTRNWMS